MKKFGSFLLAGILLFSAVACGGASKTYTMDIPAFCQEAISEGGYPQMEQFEEKQLLIKYPDLSMNEIEEFAFYLEATGGVADELTVLKVKDDAYGETVEKAMKAHSEAMITFVKSYNESQVTRIENALIMRKGSYYLYAISDDTAKVKELFNQYCKEA